MVETSGGWAGADETHLAWLEQVSEQVDVGGHHVLPLPDKVWVLHPLLERTDGRPLRDLYPTLAF